MYYILFYTQTHIYAYTYTHALAQDQDLFICNNTQYTYILCSHEVLSSI